MVVTGLLVAEITTTSVNLTWSPPGDNGGHMIVYYIIQYGIAGQNNLWLLPWQPMDTAEGAIAEFVVHKIIFLISSLLNLMYYLFKIISFSCHLVYYYF